MGTPTISTRDMRKIPELHFACGQICCENSIPWWACFGYAAQQIGATDAEAVYEVAMQWLEGWLNQWASVTGEKPPPALTVLARKGKQLCPPLILTLAGKRKAPPEPEAAIPE